MDTVFVGAKTHISSGSSYSSGYDSTTRHLGAFESPKGQNILQRAARDTSPLEGDSSIAEYFSGTYVNPGYGLPFKLCTPPSSQADPYCAHIKSNFTSIDPGYEGVGELVGQWARIWSSHIRMTPIPPLASALEGTNANRTFKYHIDMVRIFVEGYGQDTTPFFQTEGPAGVEARFVFEEETGRVYGFGLFGGIDGLEDGITERERRAKGKVGEVEMGADVWFEKTV